MAQKPDSPALAPDEIAALIDQSQPEALGGHDSRRLGRLVRQLQAARDQAKAADDQSQVKTIAAALRRAKAETERRAAEGGDAAPKPAKTDAAQDGVVKAPGARAAAAAEIPAVPKGAEPLAEGEVSRSNLPAAGKDQDKGQEKEKAKDGPAGTGKGAQEPNKADEKAERQRVKEAERAERKRLKEAEKAEKKAEKKAARKAEKAGAKA